MRIGVLGGSFDPLHNGHIALAREAARHLHLDRVLLVVGGTPPHKPDGATMPAVRRLALVEAAVADDPLLEASDLELHRDGPTFTAETLEEIAAQYPGAELWFVMGVDQLAGFSSWRRPEDIVALARIAVAMRPGADASAAGDVARGIAVGRVDLVEMPEVPVSSTLVREYLAQGDSIRHLVPAAVADLLESAPAS